MKTPGYLRSLFSSIARVQALTEKFTTLGPIDNEQQQQQQQQQQQEQANVGSSEYAAGSASSGLQSRTRAPEHVHGVGSGPRIREYERDDCRRIDFLVMLPPEIALLILTFVDAQTLCVLARVSRPYACLAEDNQLWRGMFRSRHAWRKAYRRWLLELSLQQQKRRAVATSKQAQPQGLAADALPTWKALYRERALLAKNWTSGKTPTISTITGHADSVYCVQFDRDKIVSGSRDRSVKVWCLETLKPIRTLVGHQGSVLCLQYNESYLVTGSSDQTIILWNFVTGQPIRRLTGHTAGVLDVAMDTDTLDDPPARSQVVGPLRHRQQNQQQNQQRPATRIVSCSKDTTIKVWDFSTGELLHTLQGHTAAVNAIQVRNGIIASASGDYFAKLWDLNTGKHIRDLTGHTRGIACVAFDGRYLLTGSNDHTVRVWDAATGQCLRILQGHSELVRTLAFSADLNRVVSGSYDQTVRVWDFETGAQLHQFRGAHSSWVFNVHFDESRIVSASQDQTMALFDFTMGVDKTLL
ncbi:hypothetical protein RI367_004355 [Sorochytrium milnesiophthora]